MTFVLIALATIAAGGAASLLLHRAPRLSTWVGAGAAALGSAVGLLGAVPAALGAPTETLRRAWDVPYGSFSLGLDALSGFFLIPIFALGGLAAIYGAGYLHGGRARHWLFYNLLLASMALVVLARNGVLFLAAWEVMAIASFFLVTEHDEDPAVREAGWTYLVATHIGTAFLLALFVVLGRASGSLEFDRMGVPAGQAHLAFVLALVGFGTKAGFVPLHVWLPEAHPAAPSHVSALLSGVMIKTGIYGLLRVLLLLGPPPAAWGWTLVAVGLASGILGVLFALAQHDLKRLLAYHSVENIGIIALGIGTGLLGMAHGLPAIAALGFAGGLLHVLNHAIFKGLLFLGAGSVLHRTGSRDVDRLGGLAKPMPVTAAAFLVGCVAIAGLPPLNGFASEFLIYVASFRGAGAGAPPLAISSLGTIAGLALIGGLAAACFAKAFGAVFLGEPRAPIEGPGGEASASMRLPMVALAAACVGIGVAAPWIVAAMAPLVSRWVPQAEESLRAAASPLGPVTAAALCFGALVAALALLRGRLLKGRTVARAVTWDCGYAAPTPRMQYTASSFAQPLTDLFRLVLRTRRHHEPPAGLFPAASALETHTPDPFRESLFAPAFRGVAAVLRRLRWLQHGRVQLYVLYIALTLLVLLVWKLGWR